MLRDFLRLIGSACIISGALLFFIQDSSEQAENASDSSKLKAELQVLQSKLVRTEEELAHLQTATTAASKPEGGVDEDNKDTTTEEVVKMVLLIEPGMNSTTIVDLLERSGIIPDAAKFESYLEKSNLSGKIQVGKYDVDSSMNIETIAAMITK